MLLLLPYAPGAALALGDIAVGARPARAGGGLLRASGADHAAGRGRLARPQSPARSLAISLAVGIAAGRLPSWLGRHPAGTTGAAAAAGLSAGVPPVQEWYLGELRPAGTLGALPGLHPATARSWPTTWAAGGGRAATTLR
ncbi:MAG: hypothetical protein U0Z44_03355 [Kouleothrix sp.]